MVAVKGLVGLRPGATHAARVTTPPYDVIKPGSPLEAKLQSEPASLYHVILGEHSQEALTRLVAEQYLVEDHEPAFYVYEQSWGGTTRTGVFVAAEVSPYEERQIIRHEKTFDSKVKGRIALAQATGHTLGPVFVLTQAPVGVVLEEAKAASTLYEFRSDFGGAGDLHNVSNRVWRIPEDSSLGARMRSALASQPFYIADGHHRYHAALRSEQTHFLCYVTGEARIAAYNRVVTGARTFSDVRGELPLQKLSAFETPPKHGFALYSREGTWSLQVDSVSDDVVGRLDCAALERELYPRLGITHDMITDPRHFDYYPEADLTEMQRVVDRGDYDLAIALHPVSVEELIAVADAGLENPDIVMPEKSTFFTPKVLSGLIAYRHTLA